MAHIGLTPQSRLRDGRLQGAGRAARPPTRCSIRPTISRRPAPSRSSLEAMPCELGERHHARAAHPRRSGSARGHDTDAQVLVINDLLGINETRAEAREEVRRPAHRDDRRGHSRSCRTSRRDATRTTTTATPSVPDREDSRRKLAVCRSGNPTRPAWPFAVLGASCCLAVIVGDRGGRSRMDRVIGALCLRAVRGAGGVHPSRIHDRETPHCCCVGVGPCPFAVYIDELSQCT